MPDMRAKMKKSTSSKDEAAAIAGYDSACPPKKKVKKKHKKSVWPADAAAGAAAGHAFSSLLILKEEEEEKKQHHEKKVKGEKMGKGKMPVCKEDRLPSLYLVIRHAVQRPAYSLYKVNLTPKNDGDHPVPSPYRVKYLDAEHDMSFAAVISEQRSWIVGVGGFPARLEDRPHGGRGETIVFDCKAETVAKGPRPMESKFSPVVITVGEKVYALARMPSIWLQPDFPPWFEVLDVSGASCINGQLKDCAWRPLPSPPLFPVLNQEGSRVDSGPPIVEVESYAVVGNYILLSIVRDPFTERDAGTIAFDVNAEEWHCVDRQRNLPFTGQAIPYGNHFVGRSRSEENNLTRYNISVTKTKSSLMLSIMELPDTDAMGYILPMIWGQFFCFRNGVICSVGCCTQGWTGEEEIDRDNIRIDFYGPINAVEEEAELQRTGKIVLSISKPSKYFFRVKEPAYQLIAPTLVSALWMDV
ncbi:unnamed protein product [Urochloa decumbens]|uniref:Uncharacterized protein n=1 Tax=Urochloa decumbens TaxID=240449 RepID=A0ABC9E152_9POAL